MQDARVGCLGWTGMFRGVGLVIFGIKHGTRGGEMMKGCGFDGGLEQGNGNYVTEEES